MGNLKENINFRKDLEISCNMKENDLLKDLYTPEHTGDFTLLDGKLINMCNDSRTERCKYGYIEYNKHYCTFYSNKGLDYQLRGNKE